MKKQNQIFGFISIMVIILSFTHCSSAQKLQEQTSFQLGQVTFQKWVAGVQGGGSGINISIDVVSNKNKVVFDSVYFRGYKAKIESLNTSYVANIITETNRREDMIMSNKGQDEFGNKMPTSESIFPFELTDNECIIKYIENKKTKYVKVKNLIEKPFEEYPSTPPKQP